MKKGLGIFAAAAAALLVPYKIEVDSENGTKRFKSVLLDLKIKSTVDENGDKTSECEIGFGGLPTKEDFSVVKSGISDVAEKSAQAAKTMATKVKETAKDVSDKVKETAGNVKDKLSLDIDGLASEDIGDFCTDEEEQLF